MIRRSFLLVMIAFMDHEIMRNLLAEHMKYSKHVALELSSVTEGTVLIRNFVGRHLATYVVGINFHLSLSLRCTFSFCPGAARTYSSLDKEHDPDKRAK